MFDIEEIFASFVLTLWCCELETAVVVPQGIDHARGSVTSTLASERSGTLDHHAHVATSTLMQRVDPTPAHIPSLNGRNGPPTRRLVPLTPLGKDVLFLLPLTLITSHHRFASF